MADFPVEGCSERSTCPRAFATMIFIVPLRLSKFNRGSLGEQTKVWEAGERLAHGKGRDGLPRPLGPAMGFADSLGVPATRAHELQRVAGSLRRHLTERSESEVARPLRQQAHEGGGNRLVLPHRAGKGAWRSARDTGRMDQAMGEGAR